MVEEPQLQRLQVSVEALAQVELDRERDLPGDQPADERQPDSEDRGAQDRHCQWQKRRLIVLVDRIDRLSDQPRNEHGHPHRQPGEDQRAPELRPVGSKEAHQAS